MPKPDRLTIKQDTTIQIGNRTFTISFGKRRDVLYFKRDGALALKKKFRIDGNMRIKLMSGKKIRGKIIEISPSGLRINKITVVQVDVEYSQISNLIKQETMLFGVVGLIFVILGILH